MRRNIRFTHYICECGYKHDWMNEGKVAQAVFAKIVKKVNPEKRKERKSRKSKRRKRRRSSRDESTS